MGKDTKTLTIKIGDQIGLTPPLGWNSWNCFAGSVTQEKVHAQAKAMWKSGLIQHGWTYINIDDAWQGARGGKYNALQGNSKFPDLKQMCDDIHALGLKAGIYSTPWVTSYANYPGGSAENPEGTWTKFSGPSRSTRRSCHSPWASTHSPPGCQAMGRLGDRLPQVRLEPDRDGPSARNSRCAEGQRTRRDLEPFQPRALRRSGRLGPPCQLLAHDRRH